MRLHVGGTVVLLDRKQASALLVIGGLLAVGLLLIATQIGGSDRGGGGSEARRKPAKPIPIKLVLDKRLDERLQRLRANDIIPEDYDGNAVEAEQLRQVAVQRRRKSSAVSVGYICHVLIVGQTGNDGFLTSFSFMV